MTYGSKLRSICFDFVFMLDVTNCIHEFIMGHINEVGHTGQARRLWRYNLVSRLKYITGVRGGFAIHLRDCLSLMYASYLPSKRFWMLRLHFYGAINDWRTPEDDVFGGQSDDDDNGLFTFQA